MTRSRCPTRLPKRAKPPRLCRLKGSITIATQLLDSIKTPADLKALSYTELDQLAAELRAEMIAAASLNGGHLAPSLGAVEIILALHRVLDCPKDKIVFDVGHQAYAHKLLTGRRDRFATLRKHGGISGFPKIDESPYDAHDSGHASDSLSTAMGYALARDLDGGDSTIAALIGDASFTGGMAIEALNTIGHEGTKVIIILNDNGMSISSNVGAFASYLGKARLSEAYTTLRDSVQATVENKGRVGRFLIDTGNAAKESFKQFVQPSGTLFEQFGCKYVGPIDGHDIRTLESIISDAKGVDGPVLIHAVTTKGKGFAPAEAHPDLFHGVGPFDVETGELVSSGAKAPSWTSVFSDELLEHARHDSSIVAITAAMASGTGLDKFAREFPERFLDVGIAEENAVGIASALALAGKTPVVAIYSTFLQRSYDQLMVNVALQNQHVVLCLDRAGLVGEDGPTHHGSFDLSYLRTMPNMSILAPSDDQELRDALHTALALDGPVAVRYPRGSAPQAPQRERAVWERGKARLVREGSDVALLACGRTLHTVLDAAALLAQEGVEALVYDMRWVKPLDIDAIRAAAATGHLFTFEDNSTTGGFGSGVLEVLADEGLHVATERVGLPDGFVPQGSIQELFEDLGLTPQAICWRVLAALDA